MSKHKIHSLILDMSLPTQAMAIAVHNRLSLLAESVIPELLKSAIASYDRPNTVIRIDRLELDLGDIALESLESDLQEKLREELTERLTQILRSPLQSSESMAQYPYSFTLLEQFKHFLLTGTLPWNGERDTFRDLERLVLILLEEEREALAHLLQQVVVILTAQQRLIFNISVATLNQLLVEYGGVAVSGIDDLQLAIAWLVQQFKQLGVEPHEKLFRFGTLLRCLFDPSITTSDLLFEQWLKGELKAELFASPQQFLAFQQQLAQALPQASWVAQRPSWGNLLLQHLEAIAVQVSDGSMLLGRFNLSPSSDSLPMSQTTTDTTQGANGLPVEDASTEIVSVTGSPEQLSSVSASSPLLQESPETAWWFIENSGLVLLYPYFKRYLETLNLLHNNQFISSHHQLQAIYALEVLVRGQNSYREYDLVLNKVLCGLPLSTPLDLELPINPAIAVEAEQLLQSAIHNWAIIKNTSVEGFRRSFLMRDGKLIWRQTSWTLILDRKGYDVLLEYLPYPIYVVKLPWINCPIYVEW